MPEVVQADTPASPAADGESLRSFLGGEPEPEESLEAHVSEGEESSEPPPAEPATPPPPAAEAAPVTPPPATEAEEYATDQEARKALAQDAYRKRHANRTEQAQRIVELEARLNEQKDTKEWIRQFVEASGKAPAEEETPDPLSRALTEDPDVVHKESTDLLLSKIQEIVDWRDGLEQGQAQQQAVQQKIQQEVAEWQHDATEWEGYNQGFLGRADPQTGQFRPGIYEAWRDTYSAQLSRYYPPEIVHNKIESKLKEFRYVAQQTSTNPCIYLEYHAHDIGVGGGAQPRPAAPQQPSAGAEAIAASKAAQASGVGGSIAAGANGGPARGTPQSIKDLQAAGISGTQYAQMVRKEVGEDQEEILNRLLQMEGRPI